MSSEKFNASRAEAIFIWSVIGVCVVIIACVLVYVQAHAGVPVRMVKP